MRVLVACYFNHVAGGTESYVRAVVPGLQSRGVEVGLLTRQAGPAGAGEGIAPPGVPWLSAAGQSPADLVRTAAGWDPTVVYTHGLGDPAFEAALAARFPTVYYAHNYGGACVTGSKCHSYPGVRPCRRSLGPGCLGLVLPRRCGGLNPLTAVRLYRREVRRRASFGGFRAILAASRYVADELVRNGAPADRVVLAPPFPPSAVPDPEPPAGRPPAGRLLFVGRLTALKGWSHLLRAIPLAAARLKRPLSLVVAGDGPDRGRFEADAGRLGVPAEFVGWVDAGRREARMRAADLLVVPSVWPEPFGLVGIEAGCVGLPAVGFAVGGVPDWLVPGVSGELAGGDPPTPAGLADALARALAHEGHWNRLRAGAHDTARRFTAGRHLDRLIPVLETAAAS